MPVNVSSHVTNATDDRSSAALFTDIEHIDEHDLAEKTNVRAERMFAKVDVDGDGVLSQGEFQSLYKAIEKEVHAEHVKEAHLTQEQSAARRRLKLLRGLSAVLILLVAVLLGGNAALVYALLEATKETEAGTGGVLEVRGSDEIAKTAEATALVPLIAAPFLTEELLDRLKSVRVTVMQGTREVKEKFTVRGAVLGGP